MYKTWSRVTLYHSWNRFPQANDNRISTSWKRFYIEVYTYLHGFILHRNFLNFLDFYEKNLCKQKKVRKNCFNEQEKSITYLKMLLKKHKNFKVILAVLVRSKFKTFSVSQPWWPTLFRDLPPLPTNLVLLHFTSMGCFYPKYIRFELKNVEETMMQHLNKPWPCGFRNDMRNWVNFH